MNSTSNPIMDVPAVVLCGGRASRMGSVADNIPKALLPVAGYPILWYIIGRFYLSGFRRFVLPVGHLGQTIVDYVRSGALPTDCRIECVDTGADTPISGRIMQIRDRLPVDGDFVLTNGDQLFDFPMERLVAMHREQSAQATFAAVAVRSRYGLLIEENGKTVSFERESLVSGYEVMGAGGLAIGRIYSGMCALHGSALNMVEVAKTDRFEAELFPELIASGRTACFPIEDFWYSIDTPKDLGEANGDLDTREGRAVQALKNRIETHYASKVAAQ